MQRHDDILILGGGPCGLACATLLARAGRRVRLFERAEHLGGRASTDRAHGFALNRGAHALFQSGAGRSVLDELGIAPQGRRPPSAGIAVWRGERHVLPGSPWSLLRTRLVGARDKMRLGRLLARLPRVDTSDLGSMSAAEWVRSMVDDPAAQAIVGGALRISSYCGDLETFSADAAVGQLALALDGGVHYLDGGWQRMVDAMEVGAREAGVHIETGVAANGVVEGDDGVRVAFDSGHVVHGGAVVIAAGPRVVAKLCPKYGVSTRPTTVACLDLGLSALPRPREASLALGLDTPVYYSVHSATARLAPAGGVVVHVMRYGESERPRDEMEAMLDLVQPGWRDHVVTQRYLPKMVVAHDTPDPSRGGLAGRYRPQLSPSGRIWAAGDWVGETGHLLDASLASARTVAHALARQPDAVRSEAA